MTEGVRGNDTLVSRGQIVFDDLTDDAFEDLVEQTLEESDFIEVENGIIYEVEK